MHWSAYISWALDSTQHHCLKLKITRNIAKLFVWKLCFTLKWHDSFTFASIFGKNWYETYAYLRVYDKISIKVNVMTVLFVLQKISKVAWCFVTSNYIFNILFLYICRVCFPSRTPFAVFFCLLYAAIAIYSI